MIVVGFVEGVEAPVLTEWPDQREEYPVVRETMCNFFLMNFDQPDLGLALVGDFRSGKFKSFCVLGPVGVPPLEPEVLQAYHDMALRVLSSKGAKPWPYRMKAAA